MNVVPDWMDLDILLILGIAVAYGSLCCSAAFRRGAVPVPMPMPIFIGFLNLADYLRVVEAADVETGDICSICLDTLSETREIRRIHGCGHTFCGPCISEWLAKKPVCPLCNQSIFVS